MRILLVADMRDPHAINWVSGLLDMGHTPVCISSRRLGDYRKMVPQQVADTIVYEPMDVLSRAREAITQVRPVLALARRAARGNPSLNGAHPPLSEGTGRFEVPLELSIAERLSRVISSTAARVQPDVVHALRIPYEGVAASMASFSAPMAVSLWGSDLTRQAVASPQLAAAARRTLGRAVGVHADCQRDLLLARVWGIRPGAASLLAPGNMGVRDGMFLTNVPRGNRRLVVFPRGTSPSVNYPALLRAAVAVAERHPDVTFVGVRLKGVAVAESAKAAMARPTQLILTGNLTPDEFASLLSRAIAVVSPSTGDGTPNSLLEGMAGGAVPIAGDIDSLRELLLDDLPESLIDPLDDGAITRAIDEVVGASEADWTRLSEQARAIAQGGWSRELTVPRVQDWYHHIAGLSEEETT